MSLAEQKAFFRSIKDRAFAPVYYLHGDDDFLKDEAVRQLVEAAVEPATRDFNLEIRRGDEVDAGTLASLLDTPPLMAERRVVVVRDVAALRKDARAALDRYLKRPAAETVAVLVTLAGDRADRKLADAAAISAGFDALSEDRVPKWIEHQAKLLGATIEPEAAALLYECVGNDLPALAAELDKLASYVNGGTIDEAAVGAVVGARHGETSGGLLDAILDRDAARALELLPRVLEQPKMNAVMIVMALGTQTMAVAWARARRDRGMPMSQTYGELFALLKENGGAYTGRAWGDAVKSWTRAVERWTAPELDGALELVLATDSALKESRVSSDEQVLATLVLRLCGAPRHAAA